jgi:hypothetical protein
MNRKRLFILNLHHGKIIRTKSISLDYSEVRLKNLIRHTSLYPKSLKFLKELTGIDRFKALVGPRRTWIK